MAQIARAQLVMRNEDGTSILNAGSGAGDVTAARAEQVGSRVIALGFEIEQGSLNTLSIVGPAELFERVFGIGTTAPRSGSALSSARIPPELAEYVADIFIVPPPELL